MELKGYKVFIGNLDNFKNNANIVCHKGDILSTTNTIKPREVGYHFAKRLEDTLRYGNALKEDVVVCEVTSLGNFIEFCDDYYGYYDLYVTSQLRIDKVLSREEIVRYMLNTNVERIKRFVSTYKLNNDEIKLFKGIDDMLDTYIDYYQHKDTEAFNKAYKRRYY